MKLETMKAYQLIFKLKIYIILNKSSSTFAALNTEYPMSKKGKLVSPQNSNPPLSTPLAIT